MIKHVLTVLFFFASSFCIHAQHFINDNVIAGASGPGSYWHGFKSTGSTGLFGFQQNETMFVGVGGNLYSKGFSTNAMGIFNGSLTKEDIFLYNVNSGNADFLVLKNSGNVGIGAISPEEKLTVAGNILARKVKVTVNAGADFVFESSYKLRTLSEIQAYIQQYKHLPDIASAKEMEQKGIELSEMNIKLLQKIEELTLYLIEQKEEIELLKKEMQEIKKKH